MIRVWRFHDIGAVAQANWRRASWGIEMFCSSERIGSLATAMRRRSPLAFFNATPNID